MNDSPISDQEALVVHFDFARRLAHGLISDAFARDDAVQDAFAAALASPPQAKNRSRQFLSTCLRRVSARQHRNNERRIVREKDASTPSSPRSAEEIVATMEVHRLLVEALSEIPEIYRSVLILRFFADNSAAEIAQHLGVSEQTVRTRLRRGLLRLKEHLESHSNRETWLPALVALATVGREVSDWWRPRSNRLKWAATAAAVLAVPLAFGLLHDADDGRYGLEYAANYDENDSSTATPMGIPDSSIINTQDIRFKTNGLTADTKTAMAKALGFELKSIGKATAPSARNLQLVRAAVGLKTSDALTATIYQATLKAKTPQKAKIARVKIDDQRWALLALNSKNEFLGSAVVNALNESDAKWTHFLRGFKFSTVPRLEGAKPRSTLASRLAEAAAGKGKEPKVTAALMGVLKHMHAQASMFNLPRNGETDRDAELELMNKSYRQIAKILPDLKPLFGKKTEAVIKIANDSAEAADGLAKAFQEQDRANARIFRSRVMGSCSECHKKRSDEFEGTLVDVCKKKRQALGIGDGFYAVGHDLRIRHHDREAAQIVADKMRIAALLLDVEKSKD